MCDCIAHMPKPDKSKCFVYPVYLSCVSDSIDVCTVVIKNGRYMHAVSTNFITIILLFNNENV